MKKMSQEECKQEMINILDYINTICEENSINYTLVGGSLIGAIRHKGIIPWDDDIDIGLDDKNYEKLIKILEKNNDKYILINNETNNEYYYPHAKLVSKRTYLTEKNYDYIEDMGIFVDIFRYIYLSEEEKKRKKEYKKLIFLNHMVGTLRKPNKSDNNYIIRRVCHYISKYIIGRKRIYKKLKKFYNKNKETKYMVANYPIYGYEREIRNTSSFEEYIQVDFENINVKIIKNYDIELKKHFGDYMQLPPLEQRKSHNLNAYWRDED